MTLRSVIDNLKTLLCIKTLHQYRPIRRFGRSVAVRLYRLVQHWLTDCLIDW